MIISRRGFLAAVAATTISVNTSFGQRKKQIVTAIYVKDMHCATCAKKIASKLYAVPGVVKVTTNVKKGVAVITPQASKHPSPKLIWEAVEAATFKPVKIACPLGTFTKKPLR